MVIKQEVSKCGSNNLLTTFSLVKNDERYLVYNFYLLFDGFKAVGKIMLQIELNISIEF